MAPESAACGNRRARATALTQAPSTAITKGLNLNRLLKFVPSIYPSLISSEARNLLLSEINQLPRAGFSLRSE
jgi:hypothetical protein